MVSRIHMVNQMEIKAGEMAAIKRSTFDVREFGKRLKMDHTLADHMVLAYAKAHGLQVMSPEEIQMKMQQMQGRAFDDAFTKFMVKGHTQAIAMLNMAEHMLPANNGLRSMLGNMVPIMEQHYDIASRLQIATVRRQNGGLGSKMGTMMDNMKGRQ